MPKARPEFGLPGPGWCHPPGLTQARDHPGHPITVHPELNQPLRACTRRRWQKEKPGQTQGGIPGMFRCTPKMYLEKNWRFPPKNTWPHEVSRRLMGSPCRPACRWSACADICLDDAGFFFPGPSEERQGGPASPRPRTRQDTQQSWSSSWCLLREIAQRFKPDRAWGCRHLSAFLLQRHSGLDRTRVQHTFVEWIGVQVDKF